MKPVFSTDRVTNAFQSVDGDGIHVDGDGDDVTVDFQWAEVAQVTVDAPPHERAFDTDRFYKIADVTLARPIIQLYKNRDGEIVKRQKPASELQDAAWTFDNAPYTLNHPNTGVVKRVDDIHGFYRNPRYDADTDSLLADQYIPVGNTEAIEYIEESQDVSIGFYNERVREYDGNVGDLTEDAPEEYQVNLYGDHVASVPRGRCSGEQGCGIPSQTDGSEYNGLDWDESTSVMTKKDQTMETGSWVTWEDGAAHGKIDEIIRDGCTTRGLGDMEVCAEEDDPAVVVEVYDDESGESNDEFVRHKMSTLNSWSGPSNDAMDMTPPQTAQENAQQVLDWKDDGMVPDSCGTETGWNTAETLAEGGEISADLVSKMSQFNRHRSNSGVDDDKEPHTDCGHVMWLAWGGDAGVDWAGDMMEDMDADAATHDYMEDDTYYAIAPSETADDAPKYRIENCNDATDAWNLRGAGDYTVERSTLESRIKERADELDCELPSTAQEDACGCADVELYDATTDHYNMDYYESEDAMSDSNDFDITVSVDRDSVTVDSLAEQFDAVAELKERKDTLQSTMDEMRDELGLDSDECPCDHISDIAQQSDELEELRAELDEYRESEREDRLDHLTELHADREQWEDADLDAIEAEIDRREDIFESADFSVKNADDGGSNDGGGSSSSGSRGNRRFGRGYNA